MTLWRLFDEHLVPQRTTSKSVGLIRLHVFWVRCDDLINNPFLDLLEDEDGDLAEALRRRMVVFEDLMQLNKRGMQALLKNVDKEDLRKALKDVPPEILEFFLSNVSKRQAQDLREEIEFSGPIQASRIRLAQENIVAEALKLMEEGVIFLDLEAPDDDEGQLIEGDAAVH